MASLVDHRFYLSLFMAFIISAWLQIFVLKWTSLNNKVSVALTQQKIHRWKSLN